LYETTKIPILAKRIKYKALPYVDAKYSRVINTAGHWHKHNRYTDYREQRDKSHLCVYTTIFLTKATNAHWSQGGIYKRWFWENMTSTG
jgi:hypothetical protein